MEFGALERRYGPINVSEISAWLLSVPEPVWDEDRTRQRRYGPSQGESQNILFMYPDVDDRADFFRERRYPRYDDVRPQLEWIFDAIRSLISLPEAVFTYALAMRLRPSANSYPHVDGRNAYYRGTRRFVIPLTPQHAGIERVIDGQAVVHPMHELTEVNGLRLHSMTNRGEMNNVDLMVDLYDGRDEAMGNYHLR